MIYLKSFTNHSEYLVFTNTDKFTKPNISICLQESDVHYNPIPPDYSKEYLTFVAKTDGTFKFSGSTTANTLSYSLDNGSTWTALANDTDSPIVTSGSKILWKGTCTPQSGNGIGRFTSTAQFDAEGNAMSLLFGDDFEEQTSLNGKNFALFRLFNENTNLVSTENLSLPAITLADNCYAEMFYGCTSLTTAPTLPATTLASGCYTYMFQGCTNLTTAPTLPATTLAISCYAYMFSGCTSLTTAPELPATTLANYCYQHMFQECTSLTTAPTLPATRLASGCYTYMFQGCTNLTTAPTLPATKLSGTCYARMFLGCTSLTTAPELPATTLADNCYQTMFRDCTNLTTAPSVLPATTLTTSCYSYMFYGCTSLTTAPILPAKTLVSSCYNYMFQGCSSLNYIKAMFTTTPSTTYTRIWVSGVASSGTFVKNSAATWNVTGVSGIPTGWTVQTART